MEETKISDGCNELQKMPGYPYEEEKDHTFLSGLIQEFPLIDLIEQIKQWKCWMLDNEDQVTKKRVNHRSRLRRWCKNADAWGKKGKPAQYEFEKKSSERKNSNQARLEQTNFQEIW